MQLYFRTWQAVAKAHGWNSKSNILVALQKHHAGHVWESPALNRTLATIYDLALIAAANGDRDVTTDDLRHACTLFATGRHASSKNFSNSDFDKVLALLRVLADPQNLNNLAAFQDGGELGERRRHIHVIRQAEDRYWKSIARDKFGHVDIDRLTVAELRQLSLTVRLRMRARDVRRAAPDAIQQQEGRGSFERLAGMKTYTATEIAIRSGSISRQGVAKLLVGLAPDAGRVTSGQQETPAWAFATIRGCDKLLRRLETDARRQRYRNAETMLASPLSPVLRTNLRDLAEDELNKAAKLRDVLAPFLRDQSQPAANRDRQIVAR